MKRTAGILLVLIVVLGFAVLASAGSKSLCHIPKEFCFEQVRECFSAFGVDDNCTLTDTFKVVVDQPDNRDCDNASVVGTWWLEEAPPGAPLTGPPLRQYVVVPMTGTLQQFGDGTPVLMLTGSYICPSLAACVTVDDLVTCSVYVKFDDDTLSSGTYSNVCMDQAEPYSYSNLPLTGSISCSTLIPTVP